MKRGIQIFLVLFFEIITLSCLSVLIVINIENYVTGEVSKRTPEYGRHLPFLSFYVIYSDVLNSYSASTILSSGCKCLKYHHDHHLSTADEDMRIHGKVSFKKSPGKLPVPSCLRVVFEDVSMQDVDSVVYKTEEFNVSSTDINAHYDYEFKTKKPRESHEFYAVSAVLNVGWCPDPDSESFVRDFDFLSDTTIYVPINENTTDYEVNVPVVFYCKFLTHFLRNLLVQALTFVPDES